MDSTTRTSIPDDAFTMAKGMNQAIALLDAELGDDRGATYPAMSHQSKFLNQLRYTLLHHLPSECCDYYNNPSTRTHRQSANLPAL